MPGRSLPAVAALVLLCVTTGAQTPAIPDALADLVATERAFAARALEVGWKQAFLDYFADDAIGFQTGTVAPARPAVAAAPDPPPDLQLLWEPRYGDVAASGDLGYLTGPALTRRDTAPPGDGRHAAYASVWRRQADGRFLVVADVGIDTPSAPAFAPGFTRAPGGARWRGGPDGALASLTTADAALNAAVTTDAAAALTARLAPGGRLHLPGRLPLAGARAVAAGVRRADPWREATAQGAEVAAAGDLGWTWGAWRAADARGHYLRVWSRQADGVWRLALEIHQPGPAEVLQ